MSANTAIEWCDHTFNIAWGCVKVSPGCAHCYAETTSRRWGHDVWGPAATTPRRTFGTQHWVEPLKWNREAEIAGSRARVFCSSMCDVFEDHPTIDAERSRLWPLIKATPWLEWQLLTKRPERIADHLPGDWGLGYENVWLGTSVESDDVRDRIAHLVRIPARVRFLSCEPLLGAVHLGEYADDLDWVIVGGESGARARPMDLDWARILRDDCRRAGVAFFLKQLGGVRDKRGGDAAQLDGRWHTEMPTT